MVNLDRGSDADCEKPVIGYYRSIGINAPSHAEAVCAFARIITDGQIDWELSKFVEFERLGKDIAERHHTVGDVVEWYSSGRAFFQRE